MAFAGLARDAVTRYWDSRTHSEDALYWMAHPECRRAINRRISGDPNEWPLEWFKRTRCTAPFRRGISWGCGHGPFERSAIRMQLAQEIDAFDISESSLAQARREAEKEGLSGITYAVGDFDDPTIPPDVYDVAFFHASLHHVARLERLFRRMADNLRAGATVYVEEYVGPSRTHWTPGRLGLAQTLLDLAPPSAKTRRRIQPPIQRDDPSEAIRSDEIARFLHDFFDIVEWKPYGGQMAGLVFPYLDSAWLHSPAGFRYVETILGVEELQLSTDPAATHHLVAIGRLKS